jgi:hypothetical protein
MHFHGERLATDGGDRGYVTQEVVIELIVEARVDRVSN